MAMSNRPHILWLSFEDTSPRFGCYGDPLARTPNVDRLAAEGCIYPNTFSTAPVCAPARSAIITGMYAVSIGAQHQRTTHTNENLPELPTPYECVPPHFVRLIPEYLRAAGYYCTNNIKTDYQFTPPASAWNHMANDAHWRNRPDSEQPFFSVFNLDVTHESYMWDQKFTGPLITDPSKVTVPPYLPDTPRVRETIARQYDNIAKNDTRAGQLLKELEEDGLAENTVVFLWSDHGEGMPRAKRWPYDTGIRVPMIVRYPGHVKQGQTNERLVSTLDLGPTVLSLAGLPIPNHLQGKPFVGPKEQPRDHIFATRDRYDTSYDHVRVVRDDRYKYMRHGLPGTQPYDTWQPYRNRHAANQEIWRLHGEDKLTGPQRWFFEPRPAEALYDTQVDPWEIHNLADDPAHAETLEQMRTVMDEYVAKYDRYGDVDERAMVRQWWAKKKQPVTAPPRVVGYDALEVGQQAIVPDDTRRVPILLNLICATQGASIVWTLDPEADLEKEWQLYTGPIRITAPGPIILRAQAHRIGFKPSEIVELQINLNETP